MLNQIKNVQILTGLIPVKPPRKLILAWNKVDGEHREAALTAAELEEYTAFKSSTRKNEYVATRSLLRDMVSRLELDHEQFSLQKDSFGKPSGRYGNKTLNISIAHTAERVICAIAPEIELGVDIEPLGRSVPDRLRNRIINPEEVDLVRSAETIRLWTVKEALVKLHGTGLRTNLNECTITDIENNQFSATFNNDKRAKICSFAHGNHWIAVAWNS